jgi:exosortase/archaeosortase family protein
MISLSGNIKSLLLRVALFIVFFVIVTGIIGPPIIASRLLFEYHFFIYGNLGKMVIISAIIFLLLTWKRLQLLHFPPYKKFDVMFVILGFCFVPLFFLSTRFLLETSTPWSNIPLYLATHALLVLIPALGAVGSFGLPCIRTLVKEYKKELTICAIAALVLDVGIFQVWKLWPYFSGTVLLAVQFLLSRSFSLVKVFPNRGILVENFSVIIEESCSGLDSLFLFSTLYCVIGYIDWKSLNHTKYAFMYLPIAIGLFLVNILRVYLVILIGVLVSPKIAMELFHTYAGMILFLMYFGLFMKFFYRWMKNSKKSK